MFQFLRTRRARILSVLLLTQISLYYAYPKAEIVPLVHPLSEVPSDLGGWKMVSENPIEDEVLALLRADDTLNRTYTLPDRSAFLNLYIAFFKTQRTGVAPHSPRVCLPGSGWTPTANQTIYIPVKGWREPIGINRYVVRRGDSQSLVLYWYQTHHRVIANEYMAKVYTVLDSIRFRRSDTSIVRVVLPIQDNGYDADKLATEFVQSAFEPLRNYLPH